MRIFALLSLLATSSFIAAQTTPTGPAVLVAPPASQGCPVNLSARHADDGATVMVSPQSARHGQGYHLAFQPNRSRGIVQVKLTLHGMAGYSIVPASCGGPNKPEDRTGTGQDATDTFTVAPSADAKHFFHSTVFTEKLTGVQWVELNEIVFTDGTTWHESASASCRVAPNGFMLVAGGK